MKAQNNHNNTMPSGSQAVQTKIRDFIILDKIGEGTFSSVYKVMREQDKEIFALKRIKIMKLCDKDKNNSQNEIRLLASQNHPNIIKYKECFIEDDTAYLWYSYFYK